MTRQRPPTQFRAAPDTHTTPLAPIWQWLSAQYPTWYNGAIVFHGPVRRMRIDGATWTVHLNVHGTRPHTRSSKALLTARLSVMPPRKGSVQPSRSWTAALKRELKKHGYYGGWRSHRWGGSALFYKDLADLHALQAEIVLMRTYNLRRAWHPRPAVEQSVEADEVRDG